MSFNELDFISREGGSANPLRYLSRKNFEAIKKLEATEQLSPFLVNSFIESRSWDDRL